MCLLEVSNNKNERGEGGTGERHIGSNRFNSHVGGRLASVGHSDYCGSLAGTISIRLFDKSVRAGLAERDGFLRLLSLALFLPYHEVGSIYG